MGKILITGAGGFVGSHLVDYLSRVENKSRLRLLLKTGEPVGVESHKQLDAIWGDIRDVNFVKDIMRDVEVIYHLASEVIKPGKTYEDYFSTNVKGTQNLLEACQNNKIQKFVYFSSIAVFGLPAYIGDIVNWNENRPKNPCEDYGKSKLAAEMKVVEYHNKKRIPCTIIRPTTVYGPRDHQSLLDLYKAIWNKYFFMVGNGNNRLDYVFVKDLVVGARQAQISSRILSDYILGAGKPSTYREIVGSVSAGLGRSANRYIQVPRSVGMSLGFGAEVINKVFNLKIPLSRQRIKVITSNCYFSTQKARKEISYLPSTNIHFGTKITAKWLIDNGVLEY